MDILFAQIQADLRSNDALRQSGALLQALQQSAAGRDISVIAKSAVEEIVASPASAVSKKLAFDLIRSTRLTSDLWDIVCTGIRTDFDFPDPDVTAAGVSILAAIPSYRLVKLISDSHKEISAFFDSNSDNLRFSITETLGCILARDDLVTLCENNVSLLDKVSNWWSRIGKNMLDKSDAVSKVAFESVGRLFQEFDSKRMSRLAGDKLVDSENSLAIRSNWISSMADFVWKKRNALMARSLILPVESFRATVFPIVYAVKAVASGAAEVISKLSKSSTGNGTTMDSSAERFVGVSDVATHLAPFLASSLDPALIFEVGINMLYLADVPGGKPEWASQSIIAILTLWDRQEFSSARESIVRAVVTNLHLLDLHMQHFMQPRNGILRDTHAADQPSSSCPSAGIKGRPPRKPKSSKENAPPSDPNSMLPDSKPSPAKLKTPLPPRPPSSNPLKRKLSMEALAENSIPGLSDSGVKVVVRMRPSSKDRDEGDNIIQKVTDDSLSINGQTFTFDAVADTEATQLDIFQLVGEPLVENCMAGFNSSVFAYGQTGSGKTYTMWGPTNSLSDDSLLSEQKGLTFRVFERLFARINEEQVKHADKLLKYQCSCSFLEIYNEQITDLLDPNQRNLQIREDVKSGVYVENLTEECVSTMADVTQLLMKGLSNRRTGATSINSESSRSHTVFTCVVESRSKRMADGLSSFKTSRINLVDLAGSERQKLTGAAGERLKEAGNINRSLSQLGNLINILAEISQTGKQRHIPYRDSRLTFLLQESLGGNAKLAMVCAISPSQSCKNESFSTLRFAQRAKAIKNKAVVNEVMQDDVNHLREVIRQLRDELHRLKSNGNSSNDANGGHSAAWIRRSLYLLKSSISRPITLPHVDDDGDEEMEIDEEAVEKLCDQLDKQNTGSEASEDKETETVKLGSSIALEGNEFSGTEYRKKSSDVLDVNMEEETSVQDEVMIVGTTDEPVYDTPVCSSADLTNHQNLEAQTQIATNLLDQLFSGEPSENNIVSSLMEEGVKSGELKTPGDGPLCTSSEPLSGYQTNKSDLDTLNNSSNGILNCVSPPSLSIVPCDVSPALKSPTASASPKISDSRKSLRTSMMLSASQKDPQAETKLGLDLLQKPLEKSLRWSSANALSMSTQSKNTAVTTEQLAASIRNGLEIIDSCRQSSALRRSSFRFSCKPAEKVNMPINKIDVGVQTSCGDEAAGENLFMCSCCRIRKQLEVGEEKGSSDLQLVPVDGPDSAERSRIQVPKAVEKVLAGAIRREMALEEYCNKQAFDINQLNRLVQQYKHERECNAVLGQAREDKIIRLESLMDGVLPSEEFMEEELLSLKYEHKVLKEKYENHPEVLQTRMELKKVQDELQSYRNFCDLGEREVLMEEIQDLRSQLQYYTDSPSTSSRMQKSLLQLTYSEPSSSTPLGAIPELIEESVEEKLEQERVRWTEAEGKWISLSEELRSELEASRLLAEKRKREFEAEKKCAQELEEAMQMAMAVHARLLEQYADLEEKHMQLLLRHRKIQDGIGDVKKAAARAGVKGAESKFINTLAAEISALKVERERERRYLRDENKGLQAQLRDTAEAVQAAGELLVRLKEAEDGVAAAQKRAIEAEQEVEKAYKQIDKLKKKLEKEATRPAYDDETSKAKYDIDETLDQGWREEFEPFYNGDDGELPKLSEPSWFSGYDRCNI